MPDRELPARPNLEQYKKQAKELVRECAAGAHDALDRIRRHHPRYEATRDRATLLSDAQLVIAREHGIESWPKFVAHLTRLNMEQSVARIDDPVAAFIRAACVPREGSHASGTLEEADLIAGRYPNVAQANIYTA